jgi:DNA repair exonuclease SbcCD nuclease subunit
MRIAHIADIHFRSLSRHKEYKDIFEKFIIDLKKNNVEYVFVAGDIFHTKTMGISPEFIDLLTWWLSSMAEICEVHMMLGNHDGNLANLTRQDAISPVVKALNSSRVFLYKNSGVYKFAEGYNWCIFSLFDKENWDKVKPEPDNINIACFHGSVSGCTTETGYEITDGDIALEYFKDYDFVFLGDIHKRQYLAFREVENNEEEDGTE